MANEYRVNGVDLYSIFKTGGSQLGFNTGYRINGTDLRYIFSYTTNPDLLYPYNTGYKVNGTDIRAYFEWSGAPVPTPTPTPTPTATPGGPTPTPTPTPTPSNPTATLTGGTVSDSGVSQVIYQINTDGNVYSPNNSSMYETWLTSGASSDCEVMVNNVSTIQGTFSGTTNTWISCTTSPTWIADAGSIGANARTVFDITIRRISDNATIASANITLEVVGN